MSEAEQYRDICRPRFDHIDSELAKMNKGLFEGNGKESLMTRVAVLEKGNEVPAQRPTISGRPDVTSIKTKWGSVTTGQADVAKLAILMIGLVVLALGILWIRASHSESVEALEAKLLAEVKKTDNHALVHNE